MNNRIFYCSPIVCSKKAIVIKWISPFSQIFSIWDLECGNKTFGLGFRKQKFKFLGLRCFDLH